MRFKTFVIAIAALLLVAAGTVRAEIFEQVLVKVNGEIFTKSDLEQRQVAVLRQKGEQVDLKDPTNAQLKKALDEVTPQILVDAVDEMLLVQRGRELGYKLSDEQFKQVLDNIKKENKLDTEEQFQAALKAENMTMADLRRSLERSMIIQRVQQNEVLARIGVSEDEARRYYDSHLDQFTTPSSVTLRELLVSVRADAKGINVAADEAARAKIEDLRTRVTTGGESFEKLASEVSDAASKANAGLIGPISLNDLSPSLRSMIDAMKPGDVTPVIQTSAGGYQIFKLETKTPKRVLPFDEAREQISDRVFTDKRKAEYQKYLAKLRSEAIIEWKNPEIEKTFNEGLKQQASQPS